MPVPVDDLCFGRSRLLRRGTPSTMPGRPAPFFPTQSMETAMNVADVCDRFLGYCANERFLSPHTTKAYRQDLAEFRKFNPQNEPLASITAERLIQYAIHLKTSRNLALATVKRRLACLRAMLGWAERKKLIEVSPFRYADVKIRLPHRLPR